MALMPRPPNQRETPVSRSEAKAFHKRRSGAAIVWDNTLQAKEQFKQPNKYWMGLGYNRSDVVGIDDIYTPIGFTTKGKKLKKQDPKKQKKYMKMVGKVINENFTDKERPYLRKVSYRYSKHRDSAGWFSSGLGKHGTISMDSKYLAKGKEKKFKEIMTHEMIHASRANDPNRPNFVSRLTIDERGYRIPHGRYKKYGQDLDYEESQTEFETVARAREVDYKEKYGYYGMIPKDKEDGPKLKHNVAKRHDRKLATNKTKDGKDLPATGQYAYSSVRKRWPKSKIAGLKYKGQWTGKVELVDTYWKIEKQGQRPNYVHVTLADTKRLSSKQNRLRNYERNQADYLNDNVAGGKGKVRVYHDGTLQKPGLPMSKRNESPAMQRPGGPGRGWHGEIRKHRMAALKGHRRMG